MGCEQYGKIAPEMKTPDYIAKILSDPDGMDFDALRKKGIALLQELSGENWTDYNEHDPGVTILEQLCYGLTELAYRSEFAPQDYLAGPFGKINFERHALHAASEIFPSQVLTQDDYRKILYDSIAEIEDVWVSHAKLAGESGQGLYTIVVKISSSLLTDLSAQDTQELERGVCEKIRKVFLAHRNLCEDIHDVCMVKSEPVFLSGDIQIEGLRDPAVIFADIFSRCEQQIITGFHLQRYEDAVAHGMTLEQLFSGPKMVHGYMSHAESAEPGAPITVAKLIALIHEVDGVEHVDRLGLCDSNGQAVSGFASENTVLRLQFPSTPQQNLFLRLRFSSGTISSSAAQRSRNSLSQMEKAQIVMDDAHMELKKRRFEVNAIRNNIQSLEQILPVPIGVQRSLADYHSIQHQFPAIYGINRYGMPASSPEKSRLSAHQLKAYLYLSEQLMANYLQNLQEIPRIFSVDDLAQSYFTQALNDDALPDIENLYMQPLAQTGNLLSDIVAKFDKLEERRNCVIDVMLAMYGEEFPQKSLRRFNYYEDRHEVGPWLINNKLDFLKQIVRLSRDRAQGYNYQEPAWNTDNTAGLHKKISILLGLKTQPACRSFCYALDAYKLKLIPDEQAREDDYVHAGLRLLATRGGKDGSMTLQNMPASLLSKGVHPENYSLDAGGKGSVLNFQVHSKSSKIALSTHAQESAAKHYAKQLRLSIRQLNVDCEGFHLVEHVLLRQRASDSRQEQATMAEDFHAFRISVVFPAWTARFCDREFRMLAQETICRNLPAHVFPEFLWLDYLPMYDFEQRYRGWLVQMQKYVDEKQDSAAMNKAADSLLKFLHRHGGTSEQDYWV